MTVVVAGANLPDKRLAIDSLGSVLEQRPEQIVYCLYHLRLDTGYTYDDVLAGMFERDYILHLSPPANSKREVPKEQ